MALFLSIIIFVYWVFTLGDYHEPAVIAPAQVVLGITIVPAVVLAVVLFGYGLLRAAEGKSRIYYLTVAMLSAPILINVGVSIGKQSSRDARNRRMWGWYSKADKLAEMLLTYYNAHPERFHAIPGTYEEVTVEGFLPFCQSLPEFKSLGIQHDASRLLDFADLPVRCYLDMNHDGRVSSIGWSVSESGVPPKMVGISDNRTGYVGLAPDPRSH